MRKTTASFLSLLVHSLLNLHHVSICCAFITPYFLFEARGIGAKGHFQHHVIEVENGILNEEQVTLITDLVKKRADARWRGEYEEADTYRSKIDQVPLPEGFRVAIQDVSRKEGGGSKWELVGLAKDETIMEGKTVLQLAHSALGLAMAASRDRSSISEEEQIESLRALVQKAKNRLQQKDKVRNELRGRKAADAAFWFAIAGSTDKNLFEMLADVCTNELRRFGSKPSCRAKDVWQIVERLAGAGIKDHHELDSVATKCLEMKLSEYEKNSNSLLDFHSDRCLLMIWKFSTRQKKQRDFLASALKHWDHEKTASSNQSKIVKGTERLDQSKKQDYEWSNIFRDPKRPLIIDVGCGFGVSLLGAAQLETGTRLVENWSDCNLAGVDLSGLAIGFAQGTAERWGLSHRLHFSVDSAENFLRSVESTYPGPVKLCMIQFPTPFRLSSVIEAEQEENKINDATKWRGNAQLPSTADNGFMVTRDLLQLANKALRNENNQYRGNLLLQSNCEDVAVWMKRIACEECSFDVVLVPSSDDIAPSSVHAPSTESLTKRTLDWIAMGGERAKGQGWSERPLLPRSGATETEVACILNGTPVHRCLLSPSHEN